jgi:hypothetical protein
LIKCQSIKQLLLNAYVIVLESTDNVEYTDKQLCFDDLVKKQTIRLRIINQSKTKTSFTILIIFITLFFIATIIVQIKYNRIRQVIKPFLPKTKIDIFILRYKTLKITSRVFVDYKQKLGRGAWSNVYRGNQ